MPETAGVFPRGLSPGSSSAEFDWERLCYGSSGPAGSSQVSALPRQPSGAPFPGYSPDPLLGAAWWPYGTVATDVVPSEPSASDGVHEAVRDASRKPSGSGSGESGEAVASLTSLGAA